jgi:YVTN family beta-propeller protein
MIFPRPAWRTLCLGLLTACSAAPGGPPASPGSSPTSHGTGQGGDDRQILYVANQGAARITRIDMTTNSVIDTVDLPKLGFTPNASPHDIAVEPDGSFWYVSLIGDGKVVKLDRNNRVVGSASMEVPGMMHIHPGNKSLYVTRSSSAVNPPARIGIVNRLTMAIDELDVFVPRPHAIGLEHSGAHAYVGSLGENRIATIDTETEEVTLSSLEGPIHAIVQFAVAHDGRMMVGTAQLTNQVMFFDISDPKAVKLIRAVPVNAQPWHPVFSRDGRRLYVGNYAANTVTIIDVATMQVTKVVSGEGIAEPYVAYVSPDDRYLYVSNRNLRGSYVSKTNPGQPVGTVVVIDPVGGTILKVIEVPASPTGMSSRYGH